MSESKADKLQKLRNFLVKTPLRAKWRVRRKEMTGYSRYLITQLLYEAKEPMLVTHIAFKIGLSLDAVYNHLRVLVDNNIVCDKLDASTRTRNVGNPPRYFSVCPVCPMKEDCNEKLEFWLKSGLMEPEPLPSEQFAEAGK